MLAKFLLFIYFLCFALWAQSSDYFSPHVLAKTKSGQILVAEHTGKAVSIIENSKLKKKIALPDRPYGFAILPNGSKKILVTYGDYYGYLAELDLESGKILRKVRIGHTPMAPKFHKGKVYIATRLHDRVDVVDYAKFEKLSSWPVEREPHDLEISADGQFLFVANHLPDGSVNGDHVTSRVSVFDLKKKKLVKKILLPNGAINLREMCLSPDGKYLLIASTLARFQVPTNQVEKGWISTHAMNVIDVEKQKLFQTFLLDDLNEGSANPWAPAFSDDGKQLFVSINATNEISVINWPALLAKLKTAPEAPDTTDPVLIEDFEYLDENPLNDLTYLGDLRKRVMMKGVGVKSILYDKDRLYVAQYFSDDLGVLETKNLKVSNISLGPKKKMDQVRKGHMLFSDANLCFQKWLACTTCHPDTKTDAVNWDLLNDGMGSPRNTKNLLYSHFTPPTTITGCRADAYVSVRAGIRHIQFVEVDESKAKAIDEYLKSLKPDKSPYLVDGKLSESAKRGKQVFEEKAACSSCHRGKYLTNMKMRNVGTGLGEEGNMRYDVPTLHEIWRTRPYLHDGRAATIKEVVTKYNKDDRHGVTSHLSKQELADLVEYVNSL